MKFKFLLLIQILTKNFFPTDFGQSEIGKRRRSHAFSAIHQWIILADFCFSKCHYYHHRMYNCSNSSNAKRRNSFWNNRYLRKGKKIYLDMLIKRIHNDRKHYRRIAYYSIATFLHRVRQSNLQLYGNLSKSWFVTFRHSSHCNLGVRGDCEIFR